MAQVGIKIFAVHQDAADGGPVDVRQQRIINLQGKEIHMTECVRAHEQARRMAKGSLQNWKVKEFPGMVGLTTALVYAVVRRASEMRWPSFLMVTGSQEGATHQ